MGNDRTALQQLPGTAREVILAVESVTGIDAELMLGTGRTYPVAHARNMAMYLLWRRGFTFGDIGAFFERDRTTCQGNRDSFETAALRDKALRRQARLAWRMLNYEETEQ